MLALVSRLFWIGGIKMGVNSDEHSYAQYDFAARRSRTRRTGYVSNMFQSLHIPRMSQINEHFGITSVRPESGILGMIWDRLPMIAVYAGIIWLITLFTKLFLLKDVSAFINTVSWWVMIVALCLLFLGWLLGVLRRIREWMINTF